MHLGGILITTVTLIIILILFYRVEISLTVNKDFRLIIDLGIFTITLSDFKSKGRRKKRNIEAYYHGFNTLIRGSSIEILRLTVTDLSLFEKNHFKNILLFILTSSLLPIILTDAKRVEFNNGSYLIEATEESIPDVYIKVNFLILRLIISLLTVAYYKIKYALKRGIKNVKGPNR